jgi:NADPH:quinone reductase-like Zn-dependent oxidoreductase
LKALRAWWQTPSFNALDLIGKNRAVIGVHLGTMGRAHPQRVRGWLEELFKLYAAGQIKPHIGATFPLGEAAQAHHFIHERKNLGKVLLIPE